MSVVTIFGVYMYIPVAIQAHSGSEHTCSLCMYMYVYMVSMCVHVPHVNGCILKLCSYTSMASLKL